jgi:hypothetical protein
MPLERQPGPPRVVVDGIEGRDALYELELTATPSLVWRAAFLRPPSHLTGPKSTPDVGRLYLQGATVYFRTEPRRLDGWLRRIDAWIGYANSVVEE